MWRRYWLSNDSEINTVKLLSIISEVYMENLKIYRRGGAPASKIRGGYRAKANILNFFFSFFNDDGECFEGLY